MMSSAGSDQFVAHRTRAAQLLVLVVTEHEIRSSEPFEPAQAAACTICVQDTTADLFLNRA
jgi:hypothetical protein